MTMFNRRQPGPAMAAAGAMVTRGSRSGTYEFTDAERDEATS